MKTTRMRCLVILFTAFSLLAAPIAFSGEDPGSDKGSVSKSTRTRKKCAAVLKKEKKEPPLFLLSEKKEAVIAALLAAEKANLKAKGHQFLSEAEVTELLAEHSEGSVKITLESLGFESLDQWRKSVAADNEALMARAQQGVLVALKVMGEKVGIPETDAEIFAAIAPLLGSTPDQIEALFGKCKGCLFKNLNVAIVDAKTKYAEVFKRVLDKRYFGKEYKERMHAAIRAADDLIVFRMAEGQDIEALEALEALAKDLGAVVIISPAFADVGVIPTKLNAIFKKKNFFFLVDESIRINERVAIVEPGFADKRLEPLPAALDQYFSPTDIVVVTHPRVRMRPRYSTSYPDFPGLFMSSGSISKPAYWGDWKMSMYTDYTAQREAEGNQSIVVLSRKYRSAQFAPLISGAQQMLPRRVLLTESRYGNPAGFFDLGKIYTPEGEIVPVKTIPGVIFGDLHLGATDPEAVKAQIEAFKQLGILKANPDYGKPGELELTAGDVGLGTVIIHDAVEGSPNSGWTVDKLVARALEDISGSLDVQNHFQFAAAWMRQLCKLLPNTLIGIPIDNHGYDWLVKRMQTGDFFRGQRPRELPFILGLIQDAIKEGVNPYKRIFQYFGVNTDQIYFLGHQDTLRIGVDTKNPNTFTLSQGTSVGDHGHMGRNGSRFSMSLSQAGGSFGALVRGHHHTTAEAGQSKQVGAMLPQMGFHRGPSNSNRSFGLVYAEDAIQLLMQSSNGTFLPDPTARQDASLFFPGPEFPIITERQRPLEGTSTDQFRSDPPVGRSRRR